MRTCICTSYACSDNSHYYKNDKSLPIADNVNLQFLFNMSASYAAWNPELAHLRVPFLVLAILVVTVSIAALVLALILVLRSTKRNIFEARTVSSLQWIGHSFLLGTLFFAVMYIYGFVTLGSEIGLVGG